MRTIARRAGVVLACAAATLGLTTTIANAASAPAPAAAGSVADRPAINGYGYVGTPYSLYPGPGWFYNSTWVGTWAQNECLAYGLSLVLNGHVSSYTCAQRWDASGYDLWLRM